MLYNALCPPVLIGIILISIVGCTPGVKSLQTKPPNSDISSPQFLATTEAQIWQRDPLLKRYSQWLLQQPIPIAEDGGMGKNQQHPEQVQVGWQRDGFKAVAYGISAERPDVIRKGLLAFKWAFERQSPDGRFGKSGYPEVVSFLGAYARSLLLLRDAGYRQEAESLAQYLPQVQTTLNHPDFHTLEQRWETEERLRPLTNQLFWAAFSYELIHKVQPQPQLHNKAKTWVKLGLQRQTAQGVFPEKGGSDTSYQAVSLQKLSLLSLYNSEVGRILQPYLHKGFTWLTGKLKPDHTMDVSENTRTGRNQEKGPSGKFKPGRLGDPEVFILWSHLGGGGSARKIAAHLVDTRVKARTQKEGL